LNEAVLDASVVLKWFRGDGERYADAARALRAQFESGHLRVAAPRLLCLEIVNVAGRRWHWDADRLRRLAAGLDEIGFEWVEPELERVAHWTARGLTAYDAAYVSVAETSATPLVTDDDLIVSVADEVATALSTLGG
jgi:predicted nucleic acid-binding protein